MHNRHQVLERIRQIQEEGQTGALALEKDGKVIFVYFHNGLISAISSSIPQYQFGHYLARSGAIEEARVKILLEESRKKRISIGEVAVHRSELDQAELLEIVREQVTDVLTHALKNDFEIRSFANSVPTFETPAQITLNHLLLELARKNLREFSPEPNQLMMLRNGSGLSHLPWYPQELAVLSQLKAPRTLQDLAAVTGLEYNQLTKILSVFDTLQLVDFADAAPPETTSLARREGRPYESLIPEILVTSLSPKLEVLQDEQSFISEQFKTLKVRVGEYSAGRQAKVFVVSSPQAGDGKSLVCANLAASFSKDPGRRVILVDCDLRNPSIHRYFGTFVEPGLLGYLEGEYVQPYCYTRRFDRLYIMTAGGVASNPVEMLTLDKMQKLIGYLKAEYDTVIIDSPPLVLTADAQVLTALADGLLLVVRSGKTSYSSIEKAFRNVDRNKLIGVAFNDVQARLFNTQYDYRYYHYKSRGLYPYAKRRARPSLKTYLDS